MTEPTQEPWDSIRRAKDNLTTQLGFHPEISLIDIGVDPAATGEAAREIVLRVHLRKPEAQKALQIPEQIDGVRIVVLFGNYQLE